MKIETKSVLSLKAADVNADIGLINQYSRKELTPDEVYCFSVILCNNEVDRDNERFPLESLETLAELFLGKTCIRDHNWSAGNQIARLYRTYVEQSTETNRLGEPLCNLIGCAYMLRTDATQPIIDAIDGGILKEVSIGCAIKEQKCSICGEKMTYGRCESGHTAGETYDGKLCVCELMDPSDAYEISFVAVPAQPGAGVIKSLTPDVEAALTLLLSADISGCGEKIKALEDWIARMKMSNEERARRAELIKECKK